MLRLLTSVLLVLTISLSSALADEMQGSYYIGAEGTATDGQDPHYSDLREAFDDLMERGNDGDVTFMVTSDIDQQTNVGLAFDPGEDQITIRPAEDVEPTVTFAGQNENDIYSGSLIVGISDVDGGFTSLEPTRNIVFDGSNTEGEASRDMKFIVGEDALHNNNIRVVGDVENVTIRNMELIMDENIDGNSWDGVEVVSRGDDDEGVRDRIPQNITFENNYIENYSHNSARPFRVNNIGDRPPEGANVSLIDNHLEGRRYGIRWMDSGGPAHIEGNTIVVTGSTSFSRGIYIQDTVGDDVEIRIENNEILDSEAESSLSGMELAASADYEIHNNTIQDISASSVARGIEIDAGGNFDITGNKIFDLNGDAGVQMISVANNIEADHHAFLANNMLTGFGSGGDGDNFIHGIVLRSPDDATSDIQMYHNTIYMNPLDVTGDEWEYRGITVFSSSSISLDMRNNILVNNDDNGTAVESYTYSQTASAAADMNADFNLYYGSHINSDDNTYLTRHGSDNRTTSLSQHQSITGFGDNSVSGDPGIDLENRLFINEEYWVAHGQAPPIDGISEDIAGTNRSTDLNDGPVDIGAHEYDAVGWATSSEEDAQGGLRFRGVDARSVVFIESEDDALSGELEIEYQIGKINDHVTDNPDSFIYRSWKIETSEAAEDALPVNTYLFFNPQSELGGNEAGDLNLIRYDESDEDWVTQEATVNEEAGTIEFQLTQAGEYTASSQVGVSADKLEIADVPEQLELKQNYPNPFNPETTITFVLPESNEVTLTIYDVMGREVKTPIDGRQKTAGTHHASVNMQNVASGIYIYQLKSGGKEVSKTMNFIK